MSNKIIKLYSLKSIAKILDSSIPIIRKTMAKAVKDGKIKEPFIIKGKKYWSSRDLNRWFEKEGLSDFVLEEDIHEYDIYYLNVETLLDIKKEITKLNDKISSIDKIEQKISDMEETVGMYELSLNVNDREYIADIIIENVSTAVERTLNSFLEKFETILKERVDVNIIKTNDNIVNNIYHQFKNTWIEILQENGLIEVKDNTVVRKDNLNKF